MVVCPAYSVEREPSKNQTVVVDGVSARLLRASNPTPYFARVFYVGAYHEFIFGPTHSRYSTSPIGVIAGFQHTLNTFMRGGIELHWSHWRAKEDNNPRYMMPVGLYSKISLQPKIPFCSGALAPYLTAGLGYMVPFYGGKYFTMDVPRSFGMVMFIGGGGLEWMLTKSFGFNFGFDTWLDLEANDFFAGDLSFSLVAHF